VGVVLSRKLGDAVERGEGLEEFTGKLHGNSGLIEHYVQSERVGELVHGAHSMTSRRRGKDYGSKVARTPMA